MSFSVHPFAMLHRKTLLTLAVLLVIYSLAGFLLAPWLLKRTAISVVEQQLGATLKIDKVAINPFVLSLRIDGIALDDPAGVRFIDVKRVYVNFQSSSLFRWAFTFDEVRVDAPHLRLGRLADGRLNTAFLAGGEPEMPEDAGPSKPGGLPRAVVFNLSVNDSVIDWSDDVPAEPVVTRFGPVDVGIDGLTTLPSREGRQRVVIATETEGTLSWEGSLSLNPLRSAGTASVKGSHFPLLSSYLRHDTGFDITRGDADLNLDYRIDTAADGSLTAEIDNLRIVLSDLAIERFDAAGLPENYPGVEVFRLPGLNVEGGRIRWPERDLSVEAVSLDDARLTVYRDPAGNLNVSPAAGAAAPQPIEPRAEPAATSAHEGDDWSVSLGRLALQGAGIDWVDDAVSPTASLGVDAIDLALLDISNKADARFPLTLSMRMRDGGSLSVEGEVRALPSPLVDVDVAVTELSLAVVQPYLQARADVSLDSGALTLASSVYHGPDNLLSVQGEVTVSDFLLTETEGGTRLGSWQRLTLDELGLDLDDNRFEVATVELHKPYANIFIAEDGTANLGRVEKGQRDANEESDMPETPEADAASPDISVGGIVVMDGSASFADVSLPLPFAAEIAELNGEISTIATSSREPSRVALEGRVDEYGLVRVSGAVTPLEPSRATDLKVAFVNVDVPKFSAYTIPFAGREIASGRLDLDLGYQLDSGLLVGENKIVLRDLTLGDKVAHPDAMSLPLGLAVGLLKDSSGTIDIDLPVRGDINDPEFSYGRVIGKALVNLIVKVAASPFALLGNLVGIEPSELEFLEFEPGRADLAPPQLERAAKLAEALALRPELILEIPPTVEPALDGRALRQVQLDETIDARLAETESGDVARLEQIGTILEDLYLESVGTGDPQLALDALRAQHTQVPGEPGADASEAVLDVVAFRAAIRRELIEQQPLEAAELDTLAESRAANTRAAIVQIDAGLADRILVSETIDNPKTADDAIQMRVRLGVGE